MYEATKIYRDVFLISGFYQVNDKHFNVTERASKGPKITDLKLSQHIDASIRLAQKLAS